MKKLIFTVAAVVGFLFTTYGQEPVTKTPYGYLSANWRENQYINGKLKAYTQVTYQAIEKDGKIVKGDQLKPGSTNDVTRHATFFYNERGQQVKVTSYDQDGNPFWVIVFDNEGDKIDKVFFLKRDTLMTYYKFVYNDDLLKEIRFYNVEKDEVVGKMTFEYDAQGFLVKEENFNGKGDKLAYREIVPDKYGHIAKSTFYNREGVVLNLMEFDREEDGTPRLQTTKISGGKEVDIKTTREFEFDKNGNWTRQIRYQNGVPVNMTERTYIFYE